MLRASIRRGGYLLVRGCRRLRTSTVRNNEPKVTADELSDALRGRLRVNSAELRTIAEEDINVPRIVSSGYTRELDKTLPVSGKSYVDSKKTRFDPKARLFVRKISNNEDLRQVVPPDKAKIPTLAHSLEEALSKKGVNILDAAGTRPYELVETLSKIDRLEQFGDFSNFVTPGEDPSLLKLARKESKKYYASTSAMTATLKQFYCLFNNYDPNIEKRFGFKFTRLASTVPTSFVVRRQSKEPPIFSVESDRSVDVETFLGKFGHVSEVLLTNEEEDIKLYKRQHAQMDQQDIDLEKELSLEVRNDLLIPNIFRDQTEYENYVKFTNPSNVYNVASFDRFLMRSQLDCYSDKLPGNGTFDLKSRATSSVRYSLSDPNVANRDHPRTLVYEAEFDDLVRTGALLKYSFQARIGQMDGIFVAYHNIKSFLGFEYLTLNDIDKIYFNQSPIASYIADNQFKFSLRVWGDLLDLITEDVIEKGNFDNFRVVLRSEKKHLLPFHALKVHVLPMTTEECNELQSYSDNLDMNTDDVNERAEKLFEHQKNLAQLEKTLVDRHGVLSYNVETCDYVNRAKLTSHELPKTTDKWVMEYRISREQPNTEEYLKEVNLLGQLITWAIKRAKKPKPERADNARPARNASKVLEMRQFLSSQRRLVNRK